MAFKLKKAIVGDFQLFHVEPNYEGLSRFETVFCAINEKSQIIHHNVIELNPSNSVFQLKAEVINSLNNINPELECYIGIDPGNTIGVCIILNHIFVDSTVFYSKEKLVYWIKSKLKELNSSLTIVRIGDGGGKNQKDIIDLLKKSLPNRIQLQIVNEKNTSKKVVSSLTSHEQAAIRIAKRKGYII